MRGSPVMPLWTAAYLADTAHLTTTQHGAYIRILMAIWRNGGTLPNQEKRLARTVNLTLGRWRKIAPEIMELLQATGDTIRVNPAHVRTPSRYIPEAIKKEVVERDGWICAYCEDADGPFQFDHIHPLSRGGSHDPHNLTIACARCNRAKSDQLVAEWMQ